MNIHIHRYTPTDVSSTRHHASYNYSLCQLSILQYNPAQHNYEQTNAIPYNALSRARYRAQARFGATQGSAVQCVVSMCSTYHQLIPLKAMASLFSESNSLVLHAIPKAFEAIHWFLAKFEPTSMMLEATSAKP